MVGVSGEILNATLTVCRQSEATVKAIFTVWSFCRRIGRLRHILVGSGPLSIIMDFLTGA